MTRRAVQLLLAPGDSMRIAPLLGPLADQCEVAAFDPSLPSDAVIAGSWRAPGLASLTETRRVAVWFADEHELAAAGRLTGSLAAAVTTDPAAAMAAESRDLPAVVIPCAVIDIRRIPSRSPAVRARWRQRHHLPSALVVDLRHLPREVGETAAAIAAAVVAGPGQLEHALAAGAPTVTTASTARRAGADDGRHVLVADRDRVGVATELAADSRAAALLSRAGRRLVEERNDPTGSVSDLLRHLGVAPHRQAWERTREHLHRLYTPSDAAVARRAAAAMGTLTAAQP